VVFAVCVTAAAGGVSDARGEAPPPASGSAAVSLVPDQVDDPSGPPPADSNGAAQLLGSSRPLRARSAVAGDEFIVQVANSDALAAVVSDLVARGVAVTDTWDGAVVGLTAILTKSDVATLESAAGVLAVEENAIAAVAATSLDPVWNLDRLDQRSMPLDASYSVGGDGAGVDVYVIDSGTLSSHEEFGGRVLPGSYWDFGDGYGSQDCNGHGTHVAGTVAGSTYGVAKSANIVPVKVLDCAGEAPVSVVATGINWVIDHHQAGRPAVVNISLGGPVSSTLDTAVRELIDDGISVAVAAGNYGIDTCNDSPARVEAAITVAATTPTDGVASFSNWGDCNDIFAPGVDIRSASPASNTATAVGAGTSMAAPHVAGAAALILGSAPSLGPAEVKQLLESTSTSGALTGRRSGEPDRLLHATTVPGASPARC
jgi:subtilisin family serine protease